MSLSVRVLIAASIAAIALCLSGCSTPRTEAGIEPSTTATATTATPTPTPTPTPEPVGLIDVDPAAFVLDPEQAAEFGIVGADDGVHFVVPEARLACGINSEASGPPHIGAVCVISGGVWPVVIEEPIESFCGECFANGVVISREGDSRLTIVTDLLDPSMLAFGDPALPVTPLLEGQRLAFAGISCARVADEVTCENTTSGHGFTASGAAVSVR